MRRGFTVIELMVVVAIIGMLAVLSVPTVAWALNKSKYARCGNNLRQLGAGIETYASDHDDRTPGQLSELTGGTGLMMPRAILLCPVDTSRGRGGFNRENLDSGGQDKYRSGNAPDDITDSKADCSYFYEVSGSKRIHPDDADYFFPVPSDRWTEVSRNGLPTWQVAKSFQLKFGNFDGNDWPPGPLKPAPFSSGSFPIVRCYWHNRWSRQNGKRDSKVINVSWDYNIFDSIPWWECQVNTTKPFDDGTFYQPP